VNGRPDPDRHDPAADDDVWRDLVARLGGSADDRAAGPAPTEPSAAERASSSSPLPRQSPPRDGSPEGPGTGPSDPGGVEDDAGPARFSRYDPLGIAAPRGRGPAGEEPEGLPGDFVPDEPAPVLAGADPVAVLAWCGALGGPVALLVCALVWRTVPGYAIVLLVAAFMAGVGTLIMRLPRSKDDDGDDGARL
jgi:hypothetical protein